jgi:hypothetical protein
MTKEDRQNIIHEIGHQTAFLMGSMVNSGMSYDEAYVRLISTTTYKMLNNMQTQLFCRSDIALKYLLELELSGDKEAWYGEAFL